MTDRQRGAALIGVLGVVVIVGSIGIGALERSMLQTRGARVAYEQSQVREAAEFALRRGAARAADWSRPALDPAPAPTRVAWRAMIRREGRALSAASLTTDSDRPPRILVERLRPAGRTDCRAGDCGHRLSALAPGPRDGGDVVLQALIKDGSPVRVWRPLR